MATLTLTIKDTVYNAALASFDGADDAARLAAFKAWLKADVRQRVYGIRERAAREQANSTMVAALAAIAADLGDPNA